RNGPGQVPGKEPEVGREDPHQHRTLYSKQRARDAACQVQHEAVKQAIKHENARCHEQDERLVRDVAQGVDQPG
ncbi:hypothetical protein CSC81_18220, partial [Tenacibaculum discolor]